MDNELKLKDESVQMRHLSLNLGWLLGLLTGSVIVLSISVIILFSMR